MAEGKLVVNAKKQIRVRFTNSKGKEVEMAVPDAELSITLKREPVEKLNGRDVELNEEKGQPRRVRPVGEPLAAAAPPPVQRPQPGERGQKREGAQSPRHHQGRQSGPQLQGRATRMQWEGAFHNPYSFVPAPPRDTTHVDLGDHVPVGHHRYHDDRISGIIRVRMTLKTPLLLPDAAQLNEHEEDNSSVGIKKGHKEFPVRVDADGKPLVPPTSIKGMLRSAYEAVTNSRLTVFAGHEDRLADRMPARDGLSLVPARIVAVNGTGMIELLPGDSGISGSGRPTDDDPMYAAWLPRYDRQTGQVARFAVRYPDNSLPQHRDAVEGWLQLWERTGQHPFRYWSVRKCVRVGQSLGTQPQAEQRRGTHQPVQGTDMISVRGFICVTNRNIDQKHDERVFFTTRDRPVYHPLTDGLCQQWRELIRNYQAVHQAESDAGMTGPPALNNSIWSRQIVGGEGERNLTEGTLCHSAFYEGTVIALYPVMISRRLFESSPLSLLPSALRPATAMDELSPADRVFGWVSQRGQGAYRGNVRIGPVTCESPDAIEPFGEPGLPLAILGQPKEQQARFYVAASQQGEAQQNALSKEKAGYCTNEDGTDKGLRGRKVYPHHRSLPENHWDDPLPDRTPVPNGGHFQEYRRPDSEKVRDSQNRSIRGWVKPETVFTFDLYVRNLSRVELGALLWLLDLDKSENQGKLPEQHKQHFLRLGGGKPLGFGSLRLEIDASKTHLHDGNGWRDFYATLDPCTPSEVDREAIVQSFQKAVTAAYGPNLSFGEVSFIKAFLLAAKGFEDNLPIHYPRARQRDSQGNPIPGPVPPNPAGEAFQWFVANERVGGQNPGPQVSLPDLEADSGLPMLDAPR